MKTVIANDRIGRFAELDHSVREEVQAIIETRNDAAASIANDLNRAMRPLHWFRAALQESGRLGRFS